jgi:uncharacterized repeat protein (TIGR03803 family)
MPNMKYVLCTFAIGLALSMGTASAQNFKSLLSFSGSDGATIGVLPLGSLTVSGTTIYGMTSGSQSFTYGNVFSVGVDGTNYQNLLSFTESNGTTNGWNPQIGGLTLSGTALYGMTAFGGKGIGNLFSVGADGTIFQNFHTFGLSATDGRTPQGSLTLGGTTLYGMTYSGLNSAGTVFSIGLDGANYKTLVSFTGTGGAAAGFLPQGNLTLSGTTLYGATQEFSPNPGNVFSVGTDGTSYQNLVTFTGTGGTANGKLPTSGLLLSGTRIYGMTAYGGIGGGNIFSVGIDGTNYEDLIDFTGSGGTAIGSFPEGSLTLVGTTFYGETGRGGTHSAGNIFSVGIDGSGFQDLYDFTGGTDGLHPETGLALSGGTLFGVTSGGGANNFGTVYAFALPAPTPEPGTLALLGVAATAIQLSRRRRVRRRV